jgi:hypothetical protein
MQKERMVESPTTVLEKMEERSILLKMLTNQQTQTRAILLPQGSSGGYQDQPEAQIEDYVRRSYSFQ